ncbi:efflux RND transporter permease subunit, partial [Stenotrophomonas maltophilia]|uniref:efflux RND transporter permease subunit n=2 Tax=Pseudomonadota TaxID=1224 RepID=UPI0013DD2051
RILHGKGEGERRGILHGIDRGMDRIIAGYRSSLLWALDRSKLMLLLTAITLAATIVLYVIIPKGFLPSQDTG